MVSGLGSFVQLCGWEGGTLQTNITGVSGGVLTVFWPRWICVVCVLSQSVLLRLQVALQGEGPGLHALPRSKPLMFRFSGP